MRAGEPQAIGFAGYQSEDVAADPLAIATDGYLIGYPPGVLGLNERDAPITRVDRGASPITLAVRGDAPITMTAAGDAPIAVTDEKAAPITTLVDEDAGIT